MTPLRNMLWTQLILILITGIFVVIFIVQRDWQLVGIWMIAFLLANMGFDLIQVRRYLQREINRARYKERGK